MDSSKETRHRGDTASIVVGHTFPGRPKDAHWKDGYVYIVEFENGTTKVGRTADPRKRLAAHRHDGLKLGINIARWWVSDIHRRYADTESSLIRFARDEGSIQHANEYFYELDFSKCVEFVETMKLHPSIEEERDEDRAEQARGQARIQNFLESVAPKDRPTVRLAPDGPAVILSAFFDPDMTISPASESDDWNDVDELEQRFATLVEEEYGIPVEDVLGWSYFEMLSHTLDVVVDAAKTRFRLRLKIEGRDDLLRPRSIGGVS